MKLFGYDVDDGEERERPRTLREATLLVTAAELRAIAGFLVRCADEMDEHGERFGHQTVGGFLITWQAFMAPDASSFQIPQLPPNTAAWLPWPEQRGLEGTIVVVDRDGLTWDRLRVRPTTDERALGPMQPPGVATTMRFIGHP